MVLEDTSSTSVPPPAYLPGSYNEPYVPATTAAPVLPPLHLPPPGYANTEAVAVSRKRPYDETSNPGYHPPGKRFDYKRLGGRRGGRGGMNTTPRFGGSAQVHVKNIPASLNTIAHLNNHFTRFGTLVNVQVYLLFTNDVVLDYVLDFKNLSHHTHDALLPPNHKTYFTFTL